MYLSNYERMQIMTSTFLFLILILLIKPMILGYTPKSIHIVAFTMLFFVNHYQLH